jgi:hypothetical protein
VVLCPRCRVSQPVIALSMKTVDRLRWTMIALQLMELFR